jgi:integrase
VERRGLGDHHAFLGLGDEAGFEEAARKVRWAIVRVVLPLEWAAERAEEADLLGDLRVGGGIVRADLLAARLPETHDGRPVDFKATRSTFATMLDDAGVDERIRKRLMGHRSGDVTETHYTPRSLAQLAAAVATIGLEWRSTMGPTVEPSTVMGAGPALPC